MAALLKAISSSLAALTLGCAGAQEMAAVSNHLDDAFFDAELTATASARLALPAPCGVPWLRCTALGSVETRAAGFDLGRDAPRKTVRDTMLGMRFDFPNTRSAAHGPWFIQFKVTRRSAAVKPWMPIPRHRAATLTLGTEF